MSWMTPEISMTIELYRAMPGASLPPHEAGRGYLWGEVESTDEWVFCNTIARLILAGRKTADAGRAPNPLVDAAERAALGL